MSTTESNKINMEPILDRFLRYVAIDTQSDENSESQPSTAKQFNLLKLLQQELPPAYVMPWARLR